MARLPVILQSTRNECGLTCLAMVAAFHGYRSDLATLRRRFGGQDRGMTIEDLTQLAAALDLSVRPLRLSLDELQALQCPAILHWQFDHFVVLESASRSRCVIHDPALGRRVFPVSEVSERFTGIALELSPTPRFSRKDEAQPLAITDFWRGTPGIVGALTHIVAISLAVQVLALAAPFYVQLVVDEVLTRADTDLLRVLAIGFATISVLGVIARYARDWAGIFLTRQLGFIQGTRVMNHLVRLPLDYFHSRHLGDIVSRFESVQPIQAFLTGATVAVVLDGLLALAALVLMFLYSADLAWVVIGASAVYAVLRVLQYQPQRQREHASIASRARLDSFFMETIRGVAGIKVAGQEPSRTRDWQQLISTVQDDAARLARLVLNFDSAGAIITGLEYVFVIYLAARLVIEGALTVGMVYAFLAWRSHFSSAMTSLVGIALQYRMLGLHLQRLNDIVSTPVEAGLEEASTFRLPVRGELGASGLSFQFPRQPPLFSHINLVIRAGGTLAITGPSGCGKSTCMKVLMGLVSPTTGEVTLDGTPLSPAMQQSYRATMAAVTPDDSLLAGSLRDNITFFALHADDERIARAARAACIHEEILRLPMGYDTQVEAVTTSLSAGQVQRLLIARALYRAPRILFMDEGTSHLDAATEDALMDNLSALDMTLVFITHNPKLLGRAHHVLSWHNPGQARLSTTTHPKGERHASINNE